MRANGSKAHIKGTTASNIHLSGVMGSPVSCVLASSCRGAEQGFALALCQTKSCPGGLHQQCTDSALPGCWALLGWCLLGNGVEGRGEKKVEGDDA